MKIGNRLDKVNFERLLELQKRYFLATGDNCKDDDYIEFWFNERQYMLGDYAESLSYVREKSDRWMDFLNNTAEVGNIGKHNSLQGSMDNIVTISPYAKTIDSEAAFTGRLISREDATEILCIVPTSLTDRNLPNVRDFDTFVTNNPDFSNSKQIELLTALRRLSWQYPTVAVSVFGSLYDKDRLQKLHDLRKFGNAINSFYGEELIGKVVGPIVREMYSESDNDTYIGTIITDQYIKLLLPEEILKLKLRNLPPEITSARILTLENGYYRGGR